MNRTTIATHRAGWQRRSVRGVGRLDPGRARDLLQRHQDRSIQLLNGRMTKQRQLLLHLLWLCFLGNGLGAHAEPPRAPEPLVASLRTLLGDLSWGMSLTELQRKISVEVSDYSHESFLRAELAHHEGELIAHSRDAFGRKFYVFSAGKLSRMYMVLNALAFPEGNFSGFAAALERRLGPAKRVQGLLSPGTSRSWLEWRAGSTRLRALDQTQHGGFYCLMLEHSSVESKPHDARTRRSASTLPSVSPDT
jgi:hypothetical protein